MSYLFRGLTKMMEREERTICSGKRLEMRIAELAEREKKLAERQKGKSKMAALIEQYGWAKDIKLYFDA